MTEPIPVPAILTAIVFPRADYDAEQDYRAWLSESEVAMLAAVSDPGITWKVSLKFKGDSGDHASAWMQAHTEIPRLFMRIANLRRVAHELRKEAK